MDDLQVVPLKQVGLENAGGSIAFRFDLPQLDQEGDISIWK